MSLSLRVYTN